MKMPSPALIVATAALFVALGGTSYAVMKLPNNSVGSPQIKNGSILPSDLSTAVRSPCTWVWGQGATPDHHTVCTHQDLAGRDVSHYLAYADLTGSNLTGLQAEAVRIDHVNFTGANLSHSWFSVLSISTSNLTGADLTGAIFNNVVWFNTTCPDGTNSDTNAGTCEGHLTLR